MGEVILGKIGITPKGLWVPEMKYDPLDIVRFNGQGYICLKSCEGINPEEGGGDTFMLISERGAKGEIGPRGEKGERGLDGAKGDKGDKGDPGAKGDKGDIGPTGPTGPRGATGATGPQGPAGAKGATGATGPQGPIGPASFYTMYVNDYTFSTGQNYAAGNGPLAEKFTNTSYNVITMSAPNNATVKYAIVWYRGINIDSSGIGDIIIKHSCIGSPNGAYAPSKYSSIKIIGNNVYYGLYSGIHDPLLTVCCIFLY